MSDPMEWSVLILALCCAGRSVVDVVLKVKKKT